MLALGAHTDNTYYVRIIGPDENRPTEVLTPFTLD